MNVINWFEIPVENMERATRYYNALVGYELKREDFQGVPHAIFKSSKEGGTGGALIQQAGRVPGGSGTSVYLHTRDIDASLARVAELGGSVVEPKTSIGPLGFVAQVRDPEGNLVGLHTPPG